MPLHQEEPRTSTTEYNWLNCSSQKYKKQMIKSLLKGEKKKPSLRGKERQRETETERTQRKIHEIETGNRLSGL